MVCDLECCVRVCACKYILSAYEKPYNIHGLDIIQSRETVVINIIYYFKPWENISI